MDRREFNKFLGKFALGSFIFRGSKQPRDLESEINLSLEVPPSLMFHARERHLKLLPELIRNVKNQGYQPISYEDFGKVCESKLNLPEKPCIFSFDDITFTTDVSNSSFWMWEKIASILIENECKATFAVITNPIIPGESAHVIQDEKKWEKAREWNQYGIELATHTAHHHNLLTLNQVAIQAEIHDSKEIIESRTSQKVRTLILPYGNGLINTDHGVLKPELVNSCLKENIQIIVGISGGRKTLQIDKTTPNNPIYMGRTMPGPDMHETSTSATVNLMHFRD